MLNSVDCFAGGGQVTLCRRGQQLRARDSSAYQGAQVLPLFTSDTVLRFFPPPNFLALYLLASPHWQPVSNFPYSKVEHPNCIKLHDVYITPRKVYIVTELVSGGELLDR